MHIIVHFLFPFRAYEPKFTLFGAKAHVAKHIRFRYVTETEIQRDQRGKRNETSSLVETVYGGLEGGLARSLVEK